MQNNGFIVDVRMLLALCVQSVPFRSLTLWTVLVVSRLRRLCALAEAQRAVTVCE